MKTILRIMMVVLFFQSVQAETLQEKRKKEFEAFVKSTVKTGVQIVPLSAMDLSKEELDKINSQNKEFKEKGFIYNSHSNSPKKLMNARHDLAIQNSPDFKPHYQYDSVFEDTRMKVNLSDIPLAFQFKANDLAAEEIIGFAPIGVKLDSGWSGVKMFFSDPLLGTCFYSVSDMKQVHGGVKLNKEVVRYDVNNKPGTLSVDGSEKKGFIYHIDWFDDVFSHDLDCANKVFDEQVKSELIKKAIKLDPISTEKSEEIKG